MRPDIATSLTGRTSSFHRAAYSEVEAKFKDARPNFALAPSKSGLNQITLADLMDEVQRRQIGKRIKLLRERSPFGQQEVADQLPGPGKRKTIGKRAYQDIERFGTTKWERVEQIAAIHGVDPLWIWSGEEVVTPGDLARLEGKVDQVLVELKAQETKRKSDAARREVQKRARPSRQKRPQRKQEETGS